MWIEKGNNEKPGMRVRRRDARIWYLACAVFFMVFLFTFLRQTFKQSNDDVDAANLENFDPGYIISDYQMGNYNSMTEADIQAFLTKKNPCDNTDESYYLALSRGSTAKWHFENGHFVCLSEELFGDGEVIGEGEKAAKIIWQAAQDYQINPQVLLVLLQKETGLITDRIPNNYDYRKATGYGCPDTAACSAKYYGFKNQIRNAAALFRAVLSGGWTNYPLGNNYIQYNPNAACGGSVVNIKNLATSALYRYTPYQPNQGALAAGYGTAYCGSYGNRNFYHYFEDWFSGIVNGGEPVTEVEITSEKTINDGWYQIYSKKYQNRVIDIRGGIKEGMKTAELIAFSRNSNTTSNQVFYIKNNPETGYYNIINPASQLYLNVKDGNNSNSTPIIVANSNSKCEQDWSIKKDQEGYVTFVSRCSGKVVDVTSDNRIIIYAGHGGDNQKWSLRAVQEEGKTVEDGFYQITNSGNAFDISGGVSRDTKLGYLIMFDKKDQENQKFEVKYQTDEKNYLIKNPLSNLYLTAGEKMNVSGWNNTCNQKWIIEREGDIYNLFSVCNRMAVSISNEKIGNYPAITTMNEEMTTFRFEKVVYEVPQESSEQERPRTSLDISTEKDYQIQLANKDTIDIYGGVVPNMRIANLVVFPARTTNNTNQLFRLKYDVEKDAYQIYNPKSGLYLDVERSGKENNSAVIGFNDNGGYCNQYWKLEQDEDGYRIKSLCSDKLLSVSNVMFGASSRLVIYEQNSGVLQRWRLVEF